MLGTFEADDFALNPTVSTLPTVTESRVAFRKNRLQLTEVGMPFSYPAKLSYALDGDVIGVAQNSIPLSTGQFGEHPLLIATSSGWRAAQIGTGDVYVEAILPLNGIVAKSKELIVNANANVAFATDNALFVMRGSELTKISAPLDGGSDGEVAGIAATAAHKQLSGLDPGVLGADFKAYLAGAYLAYNVRENELIVHSNAYAYAYVFSFDGGAWSKHTAPYRRLISAYPRILYVDDSRNLMSLADETPAVKPVLMLTRGMRLDESAYKRVDRLFANGQLRVPGVTDDRNDGVPYRYFRAGLYLSYDGTKYVMVDKKDIKSYALNASWLSSGCSAKFFKLLLCGQALPESCLTTVDVEVSEGLGS
jgi:hypothetical protein